MMPLLALPPHLAQAPAPDLQALAWLSGRWMGREGTESFEEQWSLQGESLLGVARTLEKGRSTFVELFALERSGEDWVLRVRMFGPALDRALRGKEEPLRLRLVEVDARHFRCEGLGPDRGTVLTYTLEAPDRILAQLSKTREGQPVVEAYRFTRVPNR